jgi:DMSO/TMAO reductase YedYZ heme-binding membrane subunit
MPKVRQQKLMNPPPRTAIKSGKPIYQSRPLSPRTRIIVLVLGDILCFLIFASLGSTQHGTGTNPLYFAWVAAPFLLGWFLTAPLLGAFKADLTIQPKKMLLRTILSWLAAWPVAMLLRWLLVDRLNQNPISFGSFLSFAIVVFIVNMILLVLWRWPFAQTNELRSRNL